MRLVFEDPIAALKARWAKMSAELARARVIAASGNYPQTLAVVVFVCTALLFELRGRTKDQVLDALRAARCGIGETPAKKGGKSKAAPEDATIEVPTVKLGKLTAGEYDKPREPLPALHFSFDEPVTHAAVLRQLGAPTTWEGDASPADILAPLVRAAAETARRIAMAEPTDVGELPPPTSTRRRAPRKPRLTWNTPTG